MRTVCHVTTAHQSNDVRVFERECRSLSTLPGISVVLAGPGLMPPGTSVHHYGLKNRPVGRFQRFSSAPLRAMHALRIIDPDIIHFHDPELLPVAVMQAKLGKVVIWERTRTIPISSRRVSVSPGASTLRVPRRFADGLLRTDKNALQ